MTEWPLVDTEAAHSFGLMLQSASTKWFPKNDIWAWNRISKVPRDECG